MAKGKMTSKIGHEGCCGMHLCKTCVAPNIIFGLLFLIVGFGVWGDAPAWFNGWSILGLFMALWGIAAMTMMKK